MLIAGVIFLRRQARSVNRAPGCGINSRRGWMSQAVARHFPPMKIALGVSGGIAAYKAAEIVRLLQDRGIHVQVVMTAAAQEFVRPLTFAALSGEKVITGMFGSESWRRAGECRVGDRAHCDCAGDRCARGGSGNGRCAGALRAGNCQRLSQHSLSCDHRSGGSGSGNERQHVESPGHAGESGNPA